ncbi:hypothetical protein, partial [Salmonella enterica]|uniref:hypothetical protein n=1 Tax=Salmonella enterica TaxID=28901 RepID=UPI003CF5697F
VLLVGESGSGKSLHLNVMTAIFDRNGTDYIYIREGIKLNDPAATESVDTLLSALAHSIRGLVLQNSSTRQQNFWPL